MDEGTDAPKDPPVTNTDQVSKTLLDPEQQKSLTSNGTITNKDSLYLKTQKRKLQPVVLVKTTEKITCNGKKYHSQLNAHLRSHSDEKPFKCDNCEKAFKYTWNLNKHKRERHILTHTEIKGFPCANCSDRFLLFSQLQQHFLAKHRSDQPQNKD
uniref:C2H2-type domain-containing protein n=1 Tax=Cyprinus carpio TaxID=7962 RepID=A0A8C2ED95_CYPCA